MFDIKILIALLMVITGSINTLVTKFADLYCSKGKSIGGFYSNPDNNGSVTYCSHAPYIQKLPPDQRPAALDTFRKFDHPFVQSFAMFIGEFCCLLAFKFVVLYSTRNGGKSAIKLGPQKFPFYVWALPACCDSLATTSMYVGLTLTHASSFQMLRGSVVIFTGFFSVMFLGKKLVGYHWIGMSLVLIGLILVGLSGFLDKSASSASASNPGLGDTIIVVAQVVVAIQMVVEEKLLTRYKVPVLQAVGWEGFFGMIIMAIISCILTYAPSKHHITGLSEDIGDAALQLRPTGPGNGLPVLLLLCGTICSIAFFNFAGLSVTESMGATTRMVLDSVRTIIIWAVCIGAKDPYNTGPLQNIDTYTAYQVAGFVVLLSGTFVYNEKTIPGKDQYGNPRKESLSYGILRSCGLMRPRVDAPDYAEPLLGTTDSINP